MLCSLVLGLTVAFNYPHKFDDTGIASADVRAVKTSITRTYLGNGVTAVRNHVEVDSLRGLMRTHGVYEPSCLGEKLHPFAHNVIAKTTPPEPAGPCIQLLVMHKPMPDLVGARDTGEYNIHFSDYEKMLQVGGQYKTNEGRPVCLFVSAGKLATDLNETEIVGSAENPTNHPGMVLPYHITEDTPATYAGLQELAAKSGIGADNADLLHAISRPYYDPSMGWPAKTFLRRNEEWRNEIIGKQAGLFAALYFCKFTDKPTATQSGNEPLSENDLETDQYSPLTSNPSYWENQLLDALPEVGVKNHFEYLLEDISYFKGKSRSSGIVDDIHKYTLWAPPVIAAITTSALSLVISIVVIVLVSKDGKWQRLNLM